MKECYQQIHYSHKKFTQKDKEYVLKKIKKVVKEKNKILGKQKNLMGRKRKEEKHRTELEKKRNTQRFGYTIGVFRGEWDEGDVRKQVGAERREDILED